MSPRLSLVLVAATLILASVTNAEASEAGFQHLTTPDGVEVGIWYPASGTPAALPIGLYAQEVVAGGPVAGERHPLIVMSHGAGGDYAGHHDTATALAKAGFIVAALTHPGDNWRDKSRGAQVEERPKALSGLITFMLKDWSGHDDIDATRIGAFGFSAGGFTVLASVGGRPKLSRVAGHCGEHPTAWECAQVKAQPRSQGVTVWADQRDPRIKAIVVAAPALGYTFDRTSLGGIKVPVQLWRAEEDKVLPPAFHADRVQEGLPSATEVQSVAGADHFDFLAPCINAAMAPQICQSKAGFDRAAFHARFNAQVVRFFERTLGN